MSFYGTLYRNEELPHRARTVYMYLYDRSDASGICWPSINTIAADLKLSRRTVQRALGDLAETGLIACEARRRGNGSQTSNLYRVRAKQQKPRRTQK